MKIFLLLVLTSFSAVAAETRAIYGEDNRIDTFASPNPFYQLLAESTAAQISQDNMSVRGNTVYLKGRTLGQAFGLCSDQRFFNQPFIANCSGTLIAPDVILTAGHCFESKDKCSKYDWVFGYKVDKENQSEVSVKRSNIYRCKEIIQKDLKDGVADYALIRLDRKVEGIKPLRVTQSSLEVGTPLVMIGYPSGLPQKVADGAFIKSIGRTEFKANVDAFQINSGSGVFNAKTGELLGILVRGVVDYKTRPGAKCTEVSRISDTEPGEDISSWTQFSTFLDTL